MKTEEKPRVSAARVKEETDQEMAARLQREFDAENGSSRGGRASRSGVAKPKKAVKRKSKAVIGSDGEEVPKKKRAGGGGGAFNKELILR